MTMAQQPKQAAPGLEIITLESPMMVELAKPEAMVLINNYLKLPDGSQEFSADDLLLDMAAMATLNPAIKECTPSSLFHCLIYAAKCRATFGEYGVWIVPRAERKKVGD